MLHDWKYLLYKYLQPIIRIKLFMLFFYIIASCIIKELRCKILTNMRI